MQMLKLFFSFLVLLMLAAQASAISFESFPEFVTLSEDEQSAIDSPTAIDTKYSAITLTYLKPSAWHWRFLNSKNFFDLSIGSADGTKFLIDNRIRIKSQLNDHLEFRFTYLQEQNLETNFLGHNLELIYWLSKNWGFGSYGELFYHKRKNDGGLAFFYRPEQTHEIKYFFTFVDFTRNDRNDQPDYFDQASLPYATGIVGRFWAKDKVEFIEYAVTLETPTRWIFPNYNYEYRYWKKLVSLYYKKDFEARIEYSQKYESKYSLPGVTSTVSTGAFKFDRYLSYVRILQSLKGKWNFTPGIAINYRSWESDNTPTSLTEFIPHIIFDNGIWNLEYDITIHKITTEHRLATIYQIMFSEKSNLRIIATWDLVGIFKNKPWGGGNAQFFLDF